MRRLTSILLVIFIAAPAALADTIHLKNGSVLKGKVTRFADDQFIILLDTGSGRSMSRAMVYIGDVARIEFDQAAGAISDAGSTDATGATPSNTTGASNPQESQPRETQREDNPAESNPRNRASDAQPRETGTADIQPVNSQPRQPSEPERDPSPVESENAESGRSLRGLGGPVKTVTVDVPGKKDWTSTGVIVNRGDRVRITATGSVTLDPVTGNASGPDGRSDAPDARKLLPDHATGALIAVISSDSDDFIFIGRAAEFTATRNGLLFLSVNEGNLTDNLGSFKAVVEVAAPRK
jgi:sRNA-binding regulator protein Hfq